MYVNVFLTNSAYNDMRNGKSFYAFNQNSTDIHKNNVLVDLAKYDSEIVTNFGEGTLEYKITPKV